MMKKLNHIITCFVLAIIALGCTDQSTFNNPSHFELENGAYVRFRQAPPTSFVPEEAQTVSITAEVYDANGNVSEFVISLEATIAGLGETFNVDNFITITQFPATINITSQTIADAIGVDLSEFGAGDFMQFTGVATRNDGVKFYGIEPEFDIDDDGNTTLGLGNTEANLLNEEAYMDAMDFNYIVACPMPDTYFVGNYAIEVIESTAPFQPIFGATTEVEFVEKNVYQRTFDAVFLAQLGIGNAAVPVEITFLCGGAFFTDAQQSGLACGGSITFNNGGVTAYADGSFDDDDELTITMLEGYPAGSPCGGSGLTVLKFTRL